MRIFFSYLGLFQYSVSLDCRVSSGEMLQEVMNAFDATHENSKVDEMLLRLLTSIFMLMRSKQKFEDYNYKERKADD